MRNRQNDNQVVDLRHPNGEKWPYVGGFENQRTFLENSLITYSCDFEVQKALASLGRTEDIQFSPDNRQLAIAGFNENCILVLEVERRDLSDRTAVHFPKATRFSSSTFDKPHGLCWLGNEALVVANRNGGVGVFRLPINGNRDDNFDIEPVLSICCNSVDGLHTPGSVVAFKIGRNRHEILVCNNYSNIVSSHILDINQRCSVESSMPLLERGLLIPDSVAVDRCANWIAISNHSDHSVFVYENDSDLCRTSLPQGILRGMLYPHGLRFSADGKTILVADAGAPFVYIFAIKGSDWRGDHYPIAQLRVMGDEAYNRGRNNPQEGGPKGIDLSADGRILVATCEEEPFVCLDIGDLRLSGSDASRPMLQMVQAWLASGLSSGICVSGVRRH